MPDTNAEGFGWEVVTYSQRGRTSRLKVPNGWLLLIERSGQSHTQFIQDAGHTWSRPIPPTNLEPVWNFRFLHLTEVDKKDVQVAIGEIALIQPGKDGSKITLRAGGPSVDVREPQSKIFELLRDEPGAS